MNDIEKKDIRPNYYNKGIEVFDIIDVFDLNFYLGNVIKYVCRCQFKDKEKKIEDLIKARTYINKQIEKWEMKEQNAMNDIEILEDLDNKLNMLARKTIGTATEIEILKQPIIILFQSIIARNKELEEEVKKVVLIPNETNFILVPKDMIPKSKIKEKINNCKFFIAEYNGEFIAIEDIESLLQ